MVRESHSCCYVSVLCIVLVCISVSVILQSHCSYVGLVIVCCWLV